VLLEVQMAGLDGFETAARLKADAGGIAPTIMMLTSADHMGDAARCRTLGLDAYLVKPVRQSSLYAAMLRAIHHVKPVPAQRDTPPPQTPRHILLAEDNLVNQRVAMGILQKVGHTVVLAVNGAQAVAAAAAQRFDVILMDMQMPEMGGAEAMGVIRARERNTTEHVPIIALTAHAMKGDREMCLNAGADGYIAKPLSPQHLLDQVQALARQSPATPTAQDSVEARRQLLASVGGDEALFSEIVQLFMTDAPAQLARIQDAIASGNSGAVCLAAHAFRGAAANFGPTPLVDSLAAIDRSAKANDLAECSVIAVRAASQTAQLLTRLAASQEVLPCAS
jgi:CheY-like chemotaxis protein/HPt (histidine-containing phosphotransfer) domain-containing protein